MNVLEPGKWAFHLSWKRKSCSVGFSEARPRGTMGDQLRGVLGTCYPPALLLPGQERLNCHCWATLGPPHQLHLAIVTMLTRKQKTIKTKKTSKIYFIEIFTMAYIGITRKQCMFKRKFLVGWVPMILRQKK